jgi:hypothetical protein
VTDLDGFGFALADIELSEDQRDYIATSLPSMADQRGGSRGLLSHPTVLRLIRHRQLAHLLWSLTGRELVAVAARLLDSAGKLEPPAQWHQDRLVAVRERLDVHGYGPWSTRVGISHVEPPLSVLDQMVVLQVHLDDAAHGSHALRVVPGSHRAGKLTIEAIQHLVETEAAVTPVMSKGTLVVMRPLLLHALSAASTRSQHYRVLHIEFAPPEAITPLQWHSTVHLHHAA